MTRRRAITISGVLIVVGGVLFYVLTMPQTLSQQALPDHTPDLVNGELMFWAGGCASCHAANDAAGEERLRLVGGAELDTPFGIFRVPNISPDPEQGIGKWSTLDFLNAMVKGVSPEGRHYYPAFPYTNYQNLRFEDLIDLKAYLDSLPADVNVVAGHSMNFPFGFRRGLGLWKLRYLRPQTLSGDSEEPASIARGQYLVQGATHCGACHTPRDTFGGEIASRFLGGAVSPELGDDGKPGKIPNISPHDDGIGDWSEEDIAYSLESGLDPDYDSFGGSMVEVQENMAELPAEDRKAIAAYLKSIPPVASKAE